jgi:hypothetical protein
VRIFLSYPSEERDAAERLNLALLQQGHDVFFDRADLPPGLEYDQAIAAAVAASDLVVFLITPASVTPGRYTLTELKLAEERWPVPHGRVLPVMMRATPIATIPNYLRAVNILVPRGDAVAEAAHEVRRLTRDLSLVRRSIRRLRSPVGLTVAGVVVALSAFSWIARPWESGAFGRRSVRLPAEVRRSARVVVGTADSGFVIAASNPPRLVRFSERGVQIGEPIDLMGEPVSMTRIPRHVIVVTRATDGFMVFEAPKLRLVDSTILDPARVEPPFRFADPPRRSGDIQSIALRRAGDLWVTTGDRDGEPTVLRWRGADRTWSVATFTADTAGFGREAMGVRLREINGDIWGVRTRGEPSALYHFLGFMRIDRFEGKDRALVRCAHDIARASPTTILFLSCDNELQEVYADASEFRLVRTRRTLPADRAAGTHSYDLLVTDSSRVIVALSTVADEPRDKPRRARIAEVDSAGTVQSLLDEPDAAVQSIGVTPTSVVAVLRRADGSTDVVVVPRKR